MPAADRDSELLETLVMIGKGQAKTTLMAALAVYHLLIVPNAQVFVGASDKIQAGELERTASHFVLSEPEIAQHAKVLGGTHEIRSLDDQGFIRVLASDDSKAGGKNQGFNPTLALVDELHAFSRDSLYGDLRSGLFKRNGLMVCITTAGWDQEGVLGQLRRSFLDCRHHGGRIEHNLVSLPNGDTVTDPERGRLTIARKGSGKSVMLEWACRDDDDLNDMAVVKLANPASWVTIQSLEDARESLTPWNFQRYRANRWTLGFESWIPVGSWDALAEPGLELQEGAPTVAALDMARYRDCAALVFVQARDGKPSAVEAQVWRPGGQDDPVSYSEVMDAIRAGHERFDLRAVGYDPRWFDQAAHELEDEGVAMEVFAQGNERMCPAAAELRTDILGGNLAFNPDHEHAGTLAAHVMGAVARDVGANAFKLDKSRKNGPDIDGAEALAMANYLSKLDNDTSSMYDDDDVTI